MRLRFKSILSRIIWLHLIALTGVFGAVSAAAYYILAGSADDFEARVLRDHAAAVAEHLMLKGADWALVLPPDLEALYSGGYGGYVLAVVEDSGRIVFSSLPDKKILAAPGDSDNAAQSFFRQPHEKSVFYGVNYPLEANGRHAVIQVAQDLESSDVILDDVIANFLWRIAWVGIAIFAILAAIDVAIVRGALQPIMDASRMAQSLGPNTIALRLPTAGLPVEVLPLVAAINQALDRLEQGFRLQREFTADAAHELRTPLSVLRTHVDVLENPAVAAELRPYIEGMTRLVGQLLELAELESFTIGAEERADLTAVCAEAVSIMAPIALANQKTIAMTGEQPHHWIPGNAELLFRAIRNLIDNAIRHTAAGTSVEVELNGGSSVAVKDRGPGISLLDRKQIFARFWRRDRRSDDHSGLGLSIVERVVQIHGGSVRVDERPGGGSIFTVSLPAERAA